jgi:hypothetical protein
MAWNYGINGFYDPFSNYGNPNGFAGWDSPFVRNDLSTQPGMERGVYSRFLAENGFGGQTNRDRFAQAQFGPMEDAYKAALLTNPNLNRIDFYKQNFDAHALDNAYAALAPSQRGQFAPAQTRWIRF